LSADQLPKKDTHFENPFPKDLSVFRNNDYNTAMTHSENDFLILGGGIAGLVAAHAAQKNGLNGLLLEKGPMVGGVIQSEWKDRCLLEYGPNTVMLNGALMGLIEELNLQEDMLLADPKTPRYVQIDHTLYSLPLSPLGLLSTELLSIGDKLRFFCEPFIPASKKDSDESLSDFISRRFGSATLERLVKPFVNGIWAGDGDSLSAQATFPKLKEFEKEKGSVIKGAVSQQKNRNQSRIPKGLLSFKDGLGTLPRALARSLKDVIKVEEDAVGIQ